MSLRKWGCTRKSINSQRVAQISRREKRMAAIDTFDWYNEQTPKNIDERTRDFIKKQRRSLMGLRSEDERKRFVFQYIREVYEKNGQVSSAPHGG